MADRKNPTGALPSSPGLLRPEEFARHAVFDEAPPTDAVAYWVERIWSVAWDLPPGTAHVTSLVPHPSLSLTVERGGGEREGRTGDGVWLTGVTTRRFDVTQHGFGEVVGAKFHPGGFTALTGRASLPLTDRVVPAAGSFPGTGELADLPLPASSAREALCGYLESLDAQPDARYEQVGALFARMTDERITRVSQWAEASGLSERTMQRLLSEYVGVGPKWLLMRQRLHDAVARIDAGTAGSFADLAAYLGWYDQNHFISDFTAIVGISPAAYRDRTAPPIPFCERKIAHSVDLPFTERGVGR